MATKIYADENPISTNDKTDYNRIDNMTDEEIEENASSDEDSYTPTVEDLKKFRKVKKNG